MNQQHFTIFIDESGRFSEEDLQQQRDARRATTQIAGVIAPGQLYDTPKDQLPSGVLSLFPLKQEGFHTKDEGNEAVIQKAGASLDLMSSHGYLPIRIRNNTGLGEGKIERTYTHMVAELITRLYERFAERDPQARPIFHLYYAVVKLGKRYQGRAYYYHVDHHIPQHVERAGQPIFIQHELYESSIRRELVEEVQYGLGLNAEVAQQILGEVRYGSARRHPMLQLADVVSACSYRHFKRLKGDPDTLKAFKEALSTHDYELSPLKAVELAEELSVHRAVGQALIMTLEELRRPQLSHEARHALKRVTRELVDDLADSSEAERATDMRVIVNELEDLVQRVRDGAEAEALIRDLEELVFSPLERAVQLRGSSCELDAVRFKVLNHALANANYTGNLKLARERRRTLEVLHGSVNHRFELLQTLMRCRLNIASSCHDCFELDEALSLSLEVAQFYRDMREMMGAFEGSELLSPDLKISGCGMALNAALRVELALLIRGIGDVEVARGHAQEALKDFTRGSEQARVYQQLAHVEAVTGHFDEAWEALCYGLDPHRASPPATGEARTACLTHMIDTLREQGGERLTVERFALMHTLTLAARQAWAQPETSDHLTVHLITVCREVNSALFEGELDDYPAHAILSATAELAAHHGSSLMTSALRSLSSLCEGQRGLLGALPLVAIASCASVLVKRGKPSQALDLLNLKGLRMSPLAQVTQRLKDLYYDAGAPKLSAWIEALGARAQSLRDAPPSAQITLAEELYALCQRCPH